MSTTARQIIDYVRGQLLEPVAGFFTDAELLARVNEAQADFFGRVRGKDSIFTTNTVVGRQSYPIPSTVVAVRGLMINLPEDGKDNWKPLDATSLEKIMQEHPNWMSDAEEDRGDPERFFIYDGSLYIHPCPKTDGQEITAFTKSIPGALTLVTQTLEMDDTLVEAVRSYVLWKAWEKDKEPERAALAKATYQEYVGQGRRFATRQNMALRNRLDNDSGRGFTRLGGGS